MPLSGWQSMFMVLNEQQPKKGLSTFDLCVFSSLGALMFLTTFLMKALPNIHLLALFIAAFTIVYRKKALIPIYIYVLLEGIVGGFSLWWLPYLYIWLPLWGIVMLVSKIKMKKSVQIPVYMILCAHHGLSFGTLYAPAQALMFGLDFEGMLLWIAAGIPFDIAHAIGDFAAASLVVPLSALLKKLHKNTI